MGAPDDRASSNWETPENWPNCAWFETTGASVAEFGPPGLISTSRPFSVKYPLWTATTSPIWPLLINQSYWIRTLAVSALALSGMRMLTPGPAAMTPRAALDLRKVRRLMPFAHPFSISLIRLPLQNVCHPATSRSPRDARQDRGNRRSAP